MKTPSEIDAMIERVALKAKDQNSPHPTGAHAAAEAAGEHYHNPEACGDEWEDGDEIGMRRVRRAPGNNQNGKDWAEVWNGIASEKLDGVDCGPQVQSAYDTPGPMTLDRAPIHGPFIPGHAKPGANQGPTVTVIPQGQPEAAGINRPNLGAGHD